MPCQQCTHHDGTHGHMLPDSAQLSGLPGHVLLGVAIRYIGDLATVWDTAGNLKSYSGSPVLLGGTSTANAVAGGSLAPRLPACHACLCTKHEHMLGWASLAWKPGPATPRDPVPCTMACAGSRSFPMPSRDESEAPRGAGPSRLAGQLETDVLPCSAAA